MQLFERYHFGITVGERSSNVWSVIRLLLFRSSIFNIHLSLSLARFARKLDRLDRLGKEAPLYWLDEYSDPIEEIKGIQEEKISGDHL